MAYLTYDHEEPEMTNDHKDSAYISCTATFECDESIFTIIAADADELFEHFECFDIKEEDFSEKVIDWFKENNFEYKCDFEDEYEYDSYEYLIGFENLIRHCYFTFTLNDAAFLALKMRWL